MLPSPTIPTDVLTSGNPTEIYLKVGETATESDLVPLASNFSWSPSPQTEQVDVYGNTFPFASKNGLGMSFSFNSYAQAANAKITELRAAGKLTGTSALATFVIVYGDRSAEYGACTIDSVIKNPPARGSEFWVISCTLVGELFNVDSVDDSQ